MDGFKKLPKMQHFKQGGSVQNAYCSGGKAYKKGGEVHDKVDEKEDKKLIKKAFKMHDEQSHDEKTDLSKLKKGGRAKKEVGTVKKFQKETVVGMKKTAEDKKQIAEVKKTKVDKLCGGGAPKVVKKKEGGAIQNMSNGKAVAAEALKRAIPRREIVAKPETQGGLSRIAPSWASLRGRWNPERIKGGATVQPTPIPTPAPKPAIEPQIKPTPTVVAQPATNAAVVNTVPANAAAPSAPVAQAYQQTNIGEGNPMNGQFAAMKRGGKTKKGKC